MARAGQSPRHPHVDEPRRAGRGHAAVPAPRQGAEREFDTSPSVETEAEYRAILRVSRDRGRALSRPVLGVLPFDAGGGTHDALLASGCARELVNILGRVGDLLVIDWRATEGYGPATLDLGRVGEELDARFVLRGDVRTEGGKVRLSAHLVELPRQLVRWSGTY